MNYTTIIELGEDGMFVATCPDLPGCTAQGSTRGDAAANIADAIAGYLASLDKHGELPCTPR